MDRCSGVGARHLIALIDAGGAISFVGSVTRATGRSAAGDEHVLPALIGERLAGEAAMERLQLETGYVEEPEPLVLRGPPE